MTQQWNVSVTEKLIDKLVAPFTLGLAMGTIIKFYDQDNPRGRPLAQDEIDVLLGDLPSGLLIPKGIGATDDVSQPNLREEAKATINRGVERMEKRQFVSRQQKVARVIGIGLVSRAWHTLGFVCALSQVEEARWCIGPRG